MTTTRALRPQLAEPPLPMRSKSSRAAAPASLQIKAPKSIVIGTSTGGPQALMELLEPLSPYLGTVPVFIVIHMPPAFMPVVANQIEMATGRRTTTAENGERPKAGHIYIAPGDRHLRIVKVGGVVSLCHLDAPPENFCRPAADVLFRTAAQVFRQDLLALVLTGMGTDGCAGAQAVVDHGGAVFAQDEASSVVWGMPGAVARAGLASAVLPLDRMASTIANLLRGRNQEDLK